MLQLWSVSRWLTEGKNHRNPNNSVCFWRPAKIDQSLAIVIANERFTVAHPVDKF